MAIINRLMIGGANIFGVLWDKSSSSAMTRTDGAAAFSNPSPCLSGGSGSSPFDEHMPWKGIVRETFADGNVMVKIPKFWYRWTNGADGLKLQIADGPAAGFSVSPAHSDRGDGKGERDFVYVGRYKCASDYKSKSGVKPKASMTIRNARTGCQGLGTGYSLQDFAMFWTIRMLYLVEFADWNSQEKIGYGCGDGSAAHNSGASNNAGYHTGTMKSARTTYGAGVQYRYIEDLWGNVKEFCDGILIVEGAAYVTTDLTKYGTLSEHTKVADGPGVPCTNCIKSWKVPTVSGLGWALWPNSKASGYDNYITDEASLSHTVSGNPITNDLLVGGSYNKNKEYGLFYLDDEVGSYTHATAGARLQYLP